MVIWEIHVVDQAPIRAEVPDDRNLAVEFRALVQELEAYARQPQWTFWRHQPAPSPYWLVTNNVCIHASAVKAVLPVKRPKILSDARTSIGFITSE